MTGPTSMKAFDCVLSMGTPIVVFQLNFFLIGCKSPYRHPMNSRAAPSPIHCALYWLDLARSQYGGGHAILKLVLKSNYGLSGGEIKSRSFI